MASSDQCRKCGFGGSDLELGCGCRIHVRCCPLNLIISENSPSTANGEFMNIPQAVSSSDCVPCPFCRSGSVGGIKILPLSFDDLEKAVQVRKQSVVKQQSSIMVPSMSNNDKNGNNKRSREEADAAEEAVFRQIEAESSFLLLSHTTSGVSSDRHAHRTGRWSTEEVQYVDYVISAFESGTLAIPHGVKLNDLLGELLLCKSSRLTKKMKNAKLSARSYTFKSPIRILDHQCCATMSNLQERFLESVPSEPSQLELRFNMTKLWRTHFSNLCLQVGYELLDAREWVSTLEQMEGKASEAEDHIRRARRRRMSIALRTDVGEAANAGVFIGGMPARDANMQPPPVPSSSSSMSAAVTKKVATTSSLPEPPLSSSATMTTTTETRQPLKREASEVTMSDSERQDDNNTTNNNNNMEDDDDEFLAALEMTASGMGPTRGRLASEDMDFGMLDEVIDPLSMMPHIEDTCSTPGHCGAFLEEVGSYMEMHNLPFEYADVWVPSFMGDDGKATSANNDPSKLRLFPAGHATRSDMDATVRAQLNEFGSYSAHFSFAPGHGLPGRVYSNGAASWETRIHETDPSVFERAGGANVYGIKTAVGVPLLAQGIGRIVLALYSTLDIAKDEVILNKLIQDFKTWNPEPKWKLVIDLGSSSNGNKQVVAPAAPIPPMVHYKHQKQDVSNVKPPLAPSSRSSSIASAASVTFSTTSTAPTAANSSNMICHHHAPPKSQAESAATAAAVSTTALFSASKEDDALEQKIASLLGEHMPSQNSPSVSLLPHFMSLRLMLLRVSERRSAEENEKLDILKRSFEGYSEDNRRSGAELASLLARDWMFLQPSFGISQSTQSATPTTAEGHQSHAMPLPGPPSSQANIGMPSTLSTYSLPPSDAAHPTMRMIVNTHSVVPGGDPMCAGPTSRSRSVSASSSSSDAQLLADIVPES